MESNRAAADWTEAALHVGGRLIAGRFPAQPCDRSGRKPNIRRQRLPGLAAAHLAVAVTNPKRLGTRGVADRAAQASSGKHPKALSRLAPIAIRHRSAPRLVAGGKPPILRP